MNRSMLLRFGVLLLLFATVQLASAAGVGIQCDVEGRAWVVTCENQCVYVTINGRTYVQDCCGGRITVQPLIRGTTQAYCLSV
jgi:hypothetical protein